MTPNRIPTILRPVIPRKNKLAPRKTPSPIAPSKKEAHRKPKPGRPCASASVSAAIKSFLLPKSQNRHQEHKQRNTDHDASHREIHRVDALLFTTKHVRRTHNPSHFLNSDPRPSSIRPSAIGIRQSRYTISTAFINVRYITQSALPARFLQKLHPLAPQLDALHAFP